MDFFKDYISLSKSSLFFYYPPQDSEYSSAIKEKWAMESVCVQNLQHDEPMNAEGQQH